MKTSKLWTALFLATVLASSARAADYTHETQAEKDKRMAWFREARFGMFIHWGVYSVPAGEYNGKTGYAEWFLEETHMPVSQYEKFANQFNPVKFNATNWVRMAKDAGMKYIVITSKHHDGFGMFRSDLTDWCIKSTPFQRDPLKELEAACKSEGITLCFYHSIMDWHSPDWGIRRPWNDKATGVPDMDRYDAYLKGQLKELLTRYGPIGILWFDGQWESPWTAERGVDLYNYVRSLQPNIIVNNRVGKPANSPTAVGFRDPGKVGDYGTPEQEIPPTGFGPGVDWESCMTMNDHWGYNSHDHNFKSTATLVHNLIDCSSKGGNYLLNIGPTSEGLFPPTSVERLAEIGKWMKVNGEAIYDTTASPFRRLPWGRCTTKLASGGATLYLHVFAWPTDGKLVVPGLKSPIKKAYLLADPKKKALGTEQESTGWTITVPETAPDEISSTVVLKLKGAPEVEDYLLAQAADGSVNLAASDARTHGDSLRYEVGQQRDNLGFWFSADDWADWEFNVTKPGKFELSAETAAPESASFEVSLGDQKTQGTAPVTGDYGKFVSTKLGTVEISSPGKVVLAIRPVKDGWHAINLKAIRLVPSGS